MNVLDPWGGMNSHGDIDEFKAWHRFNHSMFNNVVTHSNYLFADFGTRHSELGTHSSNSCTARRTTSTSGTCCVRCSPVLLSAPNAGGGFPCAFLVFVFWTASCLHLDAGSGGGGLGRTGVGTGGEVGCRLTPAALHAVCRRIVGCSSCHLSSHATPRSNRGRGQRRWSFVLFVRSCITSSSVTNIRFWWACPSWGC